MKMYGRIQGSYKAEQIYEEMSNRQVSLNEACFKVLLAVYAREAKAIKAKACFDEMIQQGIQADIQAFNLLLSGYMKQGANRQQVEWILEEMAKKSIEYDEMTDRILTKIERNQFLR